MGKPKANICKELFVHMYVDQKKNGLEMAVLFGIGRTTVSRYIKLYGLESRGISQVRKEKFWKGSEEQYRHVSSILSERVGEKNSNYKGGHIDEFGYRSIYVGKKLIKEHRYVLQQHLGVKLTKRDDVHHINGIKLDNKIENLQVLSKEAHSQLHWSRPERRQLQSDKITKLRSERFWSTSKQTN